MINSPRDLYDILALFQNNASTVCVTVLLSLMSHETRLCLLAFVLHVMMTYTHVYMLLFCKQKYIIHTYYSLLTQFISHFTIAMIQYVGFLVGSLLVQTRELQLVQ